VNKHTARLASSLVLASATLLGFGGASPAQSPALPGWRLVWNEDFSGSALDLSRWNTENVAWPYNGELEYYQPQQAIVQGGVLNIKAEHRTFGGRNYVSARINTSGHFAQQYGRFEARMKLPAGQGLWPAFWLLPATQAWPPEIDIMEEIGSQPSTIYLTQHWGTAANVMSYGTTYTGPNYSAGYHRFAVEWSGTRVDWLIDDVVRFTSFANFPQEPMYIILNLAVGGNLPGNPNATTPFPSSALVDWVRVYQRDLPLANPGFEEGAPGSLTGWQVFGNAQQTSAVSRTGADALHLFGVGGSGPFYSGVFQDMPASPGQVWQATAFARHSAASRLTGGNFVDLKIEWYGPTGQALGVAPVQALSGSSALDTFIPSSVQATAPAGTATARVAIVFAQPGTGTGAADIDDVTFGFSTPVATTACPADFNGAGGLTVQDIFDFLSAYFGADNRADFNGDGVLSVQDLFDFLASYFGGC
jgi:beta-glucanase (GH16 family)